MDIGSLRRVGGLLLAFSVLAAPRQGLADSGLVNLHLEGGPALFLAAPQSERFGPGGAGALRMDVAPHPMVGIQAALLYAGFPVGGYDFEAHGLARPTSGYALLASAGVRLRILDDQCGYALPWRRRADRAHRGNLHGNLWVDAAVAYVRTGDLDRVGLDVGLGYELSLVDGLQLGPFVRYIHVFQPDEELDGSDALLLSAGLSVSVAFPTGARWDEVLDTDGDGLLDPVDGCPDEPEDEDGFEDEDGCPEPDNDGDGVLDGDDRCPLVPEDRDGFEDEDGCPDPDNDGDGVPDVQDSCPNEAEDADGFEDEDGCPDPDNDGDGILDVDDQCPADPEVVNGLEDTDGCPDVADIEVVDEDILLRDRIYFDFAMARIRGRSRPLLDQIVRLLVEHPEYVGVSVEGHCDEIGTDEVNDRLSELRAQRVREYLIAQGVAAERLESVGFGRRRPLRRGLDERVRQHNRRVELRIVRVDVSAQAGRARPRRGRGVAPDLGPGGVILPGEEATPPEDVEVSR